MAAGYREESRGGARLGQELGKSCKVIPLAAQAAAMALQAACGRIF